MRKFAGAAALAGASLVLSLAACRPEPPPVSLNPTIVILPEKGKILVAAAFSANFGTNKAQFQQKFRELAQSCQVTVDFFDLPPAGGELTLDAKAPVTQADFNNKAAAFQPDGILDLRITGWKGPGGLPQNSNAQLQSGNFNVTMRLLDGKKRNDLWHTSGSVTVTQAHGGDRLAQEVAHVFSTNGTFPHCPAPIPSPTNT